MFSAADLLAAAGGARSFEALARSFGVGAADIEAMARAALPLMQLGLQKSAGSATAPASFAELLDPARYAGAFDEARAAATPAATEAGRKALEQLFGSGDAAEVVAGQVAAASGVGKDVAEKVMPALAATLFGGLSRVVAESPFGALFGGLSGGGQPPSAGSALDMMAGAYRDAMGSFLKGYVGETPDPAKAAGPFGEGMAAFTRLFEAGADITEQNRKAFDQMMKAMRRD